jgi:DivIVA domain-containing protein
VSTTFPRAKRNVPGYDVSQVEAFLDLARQKYDADADLAGGLTSSAIRQTSFALHRGGYSCRHVDAALERLELAFARRERERSIVASGTQAWVEAGHTRLETLKTRFARPVKHRFRRVGLLSRGYSTADVDAFVDEMSKTLAAGSLMTADIVRSALFRSRLGGYNETQVDVVLDALVDVVLAVGTD